MLYPNRAARKAADALALKAESDIPVFQFTPANRPYTVMTATRKGIRVEHRDEPLLAPWDSGLKTTGEED